MALQTEPEVRSDSDGQCNGGHFGSQQKEWLHP